MYTEWAKLGEAIQIFEYCAAVEELIEANKNHKNVSDEGQTDAAKSVYSTTQRMIK